MQAVQSPTRRAFLAALVLLLLLVATSVATDGWVRTYSLVGAGAVACWMFGFACASALPAGRRSAGTLLAGAFPAVLAFAVLASELLPWLLGFGLALVGGWFSYDGLDRRRAAHSGDAVDS